MGRTRVPLTAIDLNGNVSVSASVQIDHRPGAAATIYQDETGGTTLTNPTTTDANGRAQGWLETGAYIATVSGGSPALSSYQEEFDSVAPGDVGSGLIDAVDATPTIVHAVDGSGILTSDVESNAIDETHIKTAAVPQVTRLGIGTTVDAAAALKLQTSAMTDPVLLDDAHGDPQYYYDETVDGQRYDIQHGSPGDPLTTPGPTLKVSRYETQTGGTAPGTFNTIQAVCRGTDDTTSQVGGIFAHAKTSSTATASFPTVNPDATAIMGFGAVFPGGTGLGLGAMFRGSTVSTHADTHCTGVEAHAYNGTGTDHTWADKGQVGLGSASMGIWLPATGTDLNAVAIQIGKAGSASPQWDVGIGFTGSGGTQGNAVLSASIRDDCTALYGHYIGGTHTTAAIAITAAGGKVLVGLTSTSIATKALIKSSDDSDRALSVQANSATHTGVPVFAVMDETGAGKFTIFKNGNTVVSGSITLSDTNLTFGTTTGTKIGTATTEKIGVWNATPVVRPAAYTQTYATPTRTHAARTALALTSVGASLNQTLVDVATAGVADTTKINANFDDVAAQLNNLRNDQQNTAQVLNQILDDLQLIGWLA